MRICFFGHSEAYCSDEVRHRLVVLLSDLVNEGDCEFWFGGYGRFDDMAYSCASHVTSSFEIKKIFVTPYITESYQKNQLEYKKYKYDCMIYPEIESVPLRFAISARNRWMVENADIVICYINHLSGGAYTAIKHAKKHCKRIINLGSAQI